MKEPDMAIALPLEIELRHGDHRIGTVVVDVPLETSAPQRDGDGNLYVTVEPPTAKDIEAAVTETFHVADVE